MEYIGAPWTWSDGIPAWTVDFGSPFLWILLATGLLVIATLLWVWSSSLYERLTFHFVRCPEDLRQAHIAVRRAPGGRIITVQRCSLLSPPTHVTCSQRCVRQI